jgi:hypothetical protein
MNKWHAKDGVNEGDHLKYQLTMNDHTNLNFKWTYKPYFKTFITYHVNQYQKYM